MINVDDKFRLIRNNWKRDSCCFLGREKKRIMSLFKGEGCQWERINNSDFCVSFINTIDIFFYHLIKFWNQLTILSLLNCSSIQCICRSNIQVELLNYK